MECFSHKVASIKALRGGALAALTIFLYSSDFVGLTAGIPEHYRGFVVAVLGAALVYLRNVCKQKLTVTLGGLL